MTQTLSPLERKARLFYQLTLFSLIGLELLFIGWFLIINPPQHPFTIFAIHAVPLLLFLPGLLKKNPRTFVWICFVILLYFCQGVMNAFALPLMQGYLGLTETLLTVSLFCCSMMAARYLAQVERTTQQTNGHQTGEQEA